MSDTSIFPPDALAMLSRAYPETPADLRHGLVDHPLLKLDALAALADSLPAASVEYNPALIPVGIAPEDTPAPTLSIAETIRTIGDNGSWMVLKRIEQHPDYAALLDIALAPLDALVRSRTGTMLGREGFIFISSPGAVTPFHFDPEHNILLQIMGRKVMTVFPHDDEAVVPAEAHEAFHVGEHHRNLPWDERFMALRAEFPLGPGDAVHMPVKAPHWVQVTEGPSISLSITWRSEWSYAEADARGLNGFLRRTGIRPASPRRWPHRNLAKSLAWRMLRKCGFGHGGH